MPSKGVARKDKIAMNLFGRQSKTIASIIGTLFLSVLIVACGSSNGGGGSNTINGNNGKGCMKIGVLLPETATSFRWDSVDRPDLQRDIPAALPGATVDYANAQGNADQQKTQADAALTKGDCILVVAPSDAVKASAIVAEAKADNVPVITYDRLIQSNDLAAYVANDGMAATVIAALKQQKLNGHVLVTGQDASIAGLQNIMLGDQSMTVFKDISLEAQATANVVAAISKGNSISSLTNGATTATQGGANIPSVLETPEAIDKTNVMKVITAGFYTLAQVCQGLPSGTGGICP